MYLNRITLIGFLGSDAERKVANATNIAIFSLATKTSWKNDAGTWESRTEWHRCVAFGKLADFAGTLAKGAHVAIEGELRSHEYQRELAVGTQKTHPPASLGNPRRLRAEARPRRQARILTRTTRRCPAKGHLPSTLQTYLDLGAQRLHAVWQSPSGGTEGGAAGSTRKTTLTPIGPIPTCRTRAQTRSRFICQSASRSKRNIERTSVADPESSGAAPSPYRSVGRTAYGPQQGFVPDQAHGARDFQKIKTPRADAAIVRAQLAGLYWAQSRTKKYGLRQCKRAMRGFSAAF